VRVHATGHRARRIYSGHRHPFSLNSSRGGTRRPCVRRRCGSSCYRRTIRRADRSTRATSTWNRRSTDRSEDRLTVIRLSSQTAIPSRPEAVPAGFEGDAVRRRPGRVKRLDLQLKWAGGAIPHLGDHARCPARSPGSVSDPRQPRLQS
jgi:hypothetical protein